MRRLQNRRNPLQKRNIRLCCLPCFIVVVSFLCRVCVDGLDGTLIEVAI